MAISRVERLFLTKHFAVLIRAGVPMKEALETVGDQAGPELRRLMKKIDADVQNGSNLSSALAKHPDSFDALYISLVQAGEESGTLDDNMEFLAEQLSKDYTLRSKVLAALAYPALVVGSTIVIGLFLAWFVLPKLTDLFTSFEVALPLSTQILIFMANLMKNYGLWVMSVFGGLVMLVVVVGRLKVVRMVTDEWWLKLPIVGRIMVFGELGRFSRNMGTMLKSGIPMMKSFEITAETLTNMKFRKDLKLIETKVAEGKSISEALNDKKFAEFPKLVTRMIGVGEKSGNLEEMMMYLSNYYEDEIDVASKNLSTLLEPVLLLVIGGVVAFVALSIITPIYSLMGGIH